MTVVRVSLPHVISDAVAGASSLFTTDLDRDGDTDVLATSADDDTITWYEYDSDAEDEDQAFVAHPVSAQAAGANGVVAADFDGDGDTDLLASSATDNTIAWYENDGSQQFRRTIRSARTAAGATALVVADRRWGRRSRRHLGLCRRRHDQLVPAQRDPHHRHRSTDVTDRGRHRRSDRRPGGDYRRRRRKPAAASHRQQ